MASKITARLRFRNDQSNNRTRNIVAGETVIGSAESSDIWIRNEAYPKSIASIHFKTGRYWLQNTGWPKGLFINGTAVDQIAEFKTNDKISLGKIEITFEIISEEAQSPKKADSGSGETDSSQVATGGKMLELGENDSGLLLHTEIYEDEPRPEFAKPSITSKDFLEVLKEKESENRYDKSSASLTPNQVYIPEDHTVDDFKARMKGLSEFSKRYSTFLSIIGVAIVLLFLTRNHIINLVFNEIDSERTSTAVTFFRNLGSSIGVVDKIADSIKPPTKEDPSQRDEAPFCTNLSSIIPANEEFQDPTGITTPPALMTVGMEDFYKSERDKMVQALLSSWKSNPTDPLIKESISKVQLEENCKSKPTSEDCLQGVASKIIEKIDLDTELSRKPASKENSFDQSIYGPIDLQEKVIFRKKLFENVRPTLSRLSPHPRLDTLKQKILPELLNFFKEVIQESVSDRLQASFYINKISNLKMTVSTCENPFDRDQKPIPFWVVYAAETNEIKICESPFSTKWSELNFAFQISKELALITNPCKIPKPDLGIESELATYQLLQSQSPFHSVLKCLDSGPPALVIEGACFSDLTIKKFQVWISSEILSKYVLHHLKNPSPEIYRYSIANMIRSFAAKEDYSERIILADPLTRTKIGCPPQSNSSQIVYCTVTQSSPPNSENTAPPESAQKP